MKYVLLVCALLWELGRPAGAAPSPAAPADTVRGQARLTQQLSNSLCTRLVSESQRTTLLALTPTQGQVLLTRLLLGRWPTTPRP